MNLNANSHKKDVEKYLIDLNSEAPPLNTIVKIMKED